MSAVNKRRQIAQASTKSTNDNNANKVKYYDTRKNTLALLEKKGINFQNIELPPEESEIFVEKSFAHSALSLIPFTRAYYESLAAEEDLDNYKKIEQDKLNAAKDYELTKLGESENVLQKLLSETSNDFFYFNKLKTKLEKEGRNFNFKKIDASDYDNSAYFPPPSSSSNSFLSSNTKKLFNYLKLPSAISSTKSVPGNASSNSKSPNRQKLSSRSTNATNITKNKLRQARAKNFFILTNHIMSHQQIMESAAYSLNKESPCIWKGKSKTGKYLQCTNTRMSHPHQTVKNEAGDMVPAMLIYCAYHYPTCLSTFHRKDERIIIKIPNNHALCTECYLTLGEGPPRKLQLINAPGVVEAEDMIAIRKRKEESLRKQFALENDTKTPRNRTPRSARGIQTSKLSARSNQSTPHAQLDSNQNSQVAINANRRQSKAFTFNDDIDPQQQHSSTVYVNNKLNKIKSPVTFNLQKNSSTTMMMTQSNKQIKLTSTTVCNWTSSNSSKHLKMSSEYFEQDGYYKCQNLILRSEITGEYLPTCGFHCTHCCKDHSNDATQSQHKFINDTITTPNVYGLCNAHYMSQFGMRPERLQHPYPGVIFCATINSDKKEGISLSRHSVLARTKSTMGRMSMNSHRFSRLEHSGSDRSLSLSQSDSASESHSRRHSSSSRRNNRQHHEGYDEGLNSNEDDKDEEEEEWDDDTFNVPGPPHGLTPILTEAAAESDVTWAMPQYDPPRTMRLKPYPVTAATAITATAGGSRGSGSKSFQSPPLSSALSPQQQKQALAIYQQNALSLIKAKATLNNATRSTTSTATAVTSAVDRLSSGLRKILCLQPPSVAYDIYATKIQAWYRGLSDRERVYQLILTKQRLRRHYAALLIQTTVRQFLCYSNFQPFKEMVIASTIKFQALYRAYLVRCWYPSHRAAIIITKFFKHIRAYRFQNVIIMNTALELFFNKRDEYAIRIQSLYRGFRIRLWMFNDDLNWFILNRQVRKIQKLFQHNVRNKKLLRLRQQNIEEIEAKVHYIISKKIVKIIDKKYGRWKVHQNLLLKQFKATCLLQRVVRGWMARVGVKRLKLIKMRLHYLLFGSTDYRNNKHAVSLIYATDNQSKTHAASTIKNTTTDGEDEGDIVSEFSKAVKEFKYLDNGQRKLRQQQQQQNMEVNRMVHMNYLDMNLQQDVVYELSAFPSMSTMSLISDTSLPVMKLLNLDNNQRGTMTAEGRIRRRSMDSTPKESKGRGFLFNVNSAHNHHLLVPEENGQEHSEYGFSSQFESTDSYINNGINNNNNNASRNNSGDQEQKVQSIVPFTNLDKSITVVPTMSRHGKSLLTGPDCGPDEDILNNSLAALSVHTGTSQHTFLSASPSTAVTSIRKFLPMKIEEQHFHEIKIDIFKKAIQDYFKDLKLILNSKEYDYLIERFINPATGNMNISSLDDYFSLHKYPCRKHGFTICGKCSYYGQCMVDGCSCLLYKTSKMDDTSNTGLCECNHVRSSHRLTPESLRPLNNHRIKLETIVHGNRSLDFNLPNPKKVKGIQVKSILHEAEMCKRKKSIVDHIHTNINHSAVINTSHNHTNNHSNNTMPSSKSTSFDPHPLHTSHLPSSKSKTLPNPESKNRSMRSSSTHQQQTTTNTSTAMTTPSPLLLLDESEIYTQIQRKIDETKAEAAYNQMQLEATHKQLMSITSTLPTSSLSATVSNNIQQSMLLPDMYSSSYNAAIDPNFWKTISKNPVKSLRDYSETFNQNMPMTFIKNKEIVYTYQGSKLYTEVLNMIIHLYETKGEKCIDANSYLFLDLLVNHVTLFERHWRKMVFDIREGTLSVDMSEDEERRQLQQQQQEHKQKKQKQSGTVGVSNKGISVTITGGGKGGGGRSRKSSVDSVSSSTATSTALTVTSSGATGTVIPSATAGKHSREVLLLNSDDDSCHDLISVSMHQSNSDTSLGFSAFTSGTTGSGTGTAVRNRKIIIRPPNLELSKKLDSVFRHMGFHKKAVGGKDLDLHSFGQLKDWQGYPHDPI